MRLQSAIFDMDGTLLDSMYIWKTLTPATLHHLGVEFTPEVGAQVKTMTLRDGAAFCRDYYHLPQTVDEILGLFDQRLTNFYTNEVQAKPGVQKFLSLLKMEGVWMYVATATERRMVEPALRHAGLSDYFRGILTCREVGAGKDSPEIYERAMARLRSNKKDTVVFEDALHAVRTAKNAGFRVCAIYDPSAEEEQEEIKSLADYYIRSFDEMFETTTLD